MESSNYFAHQVGLHYVYLTAININAKNTNKQQTYTIALYCLDAVVLIYRNEKVCTTWDDNPDFMGG